MDNSLVSIIITTKNSTATLEKLLSTIRTQTYKHIEIIVVDNNSSDSTKEIAKKYTTKVFNKGPERSAQRNFGATKSKGKYIFILDSDMELESEVVKQCVQKMMGNNFGALVIPERSFGKGYWAKCKAFEREFYVGENDMEAARFFSKPVFEKFGGYDQSITGPEDWDLPLRMRKAGVEIGRISAYILHNEGRFSPIRSAKKKFYYASNAFKYLKRHPEMAVSQGNLLFRSVFFKKWKKLIKHPVLASGMFGVRFLEMGGAVLGIAKALLFPNTRPLA